MLDERLALSVFCSSSFIVRSGHRFIALIGLEPCGGVLEVDASRADDGPPLVIVPGENSMQERICPREGWTLGQVRIGSWIWEFDNLEASSETVVSFIAFGFNFLEVDIMSGETWAYSISKKVNCNQAADKVVNCIFLVSADVDMLM